MKILKKWRNGAKELAAEGEPLDWFETTEQECVEHTEGSGFWKKGSVLPMLAEGEQVFTPYAYFKANL
ncbi:MAG: hypothetical protein A2010_08465 [Nitrospirae bacterium GWD2_57_9]|nr:MAG: hypothetical protein A2010_08465 [Nitrospirae bacterium GWD2_57_9]